MCRCRAICRSFQTCKGQEEEVSSGAPVAPSFAFQCHEMLAAAACYSRAHHSLEPGIRDLNPCSHNVCLPFPFTAQASLCALHVDEVAVQSGSLPFPGWAPHRGLNIPQAPLPTGFLLGLAHGRSWAGCIPSTSTSAVSGSDSTGWPLPSGS